MNVKRNVPWTEFLDEKMTEKIIVVGKVAHVHHLRGSP